MANATILPGDLTVNGQISASSVYTSGSWVTDAMVASLAKISTTKLRHRYAKFYSNSDGTTNAVSERRFLHIVRGGTANIMEFGAGAMVVLTGADTCTIDLWKNGATILAALITLASSDTPRQFKTATFTSTALLTGDVLEVKVLATHSTGTLPQGVFAQLQVDEDPS